MSITTQGLDDVYRILGKAASLDKLERPMQQSVLLGEAFMKNYPPAPSHSLYIRTGTLGRRWTTKIDRDTNGLVGKIGNVTKYGPFVQSQMFQRRVHARTGWRTDGQFIRENETRIVGFFQQAIDEVLR